jgi:hypothetical protein
MADPAHLHVALPELEPILVNHDFAIGRYGPCAIVIWRGETTEAAVRCLRETVWSITADRHVPAVLAVVQTLADPPGSAARAEFGRVADDLARSHGWLSSVHEGDGFFAAVVRAVTTGLLLSKGVTSNVSPTVDAGVEWLAPSLRVPAGSLRTAVRDLAASPPRGSRALSSFRDPALVATPRH